jgi:hypothetical protein
MKPSLPEPTIVDGRMHMVLKLIHWLYRKKKLEMKISGQSLMIYCLVKENEHIRSI